MGIQRERLGGCDLVVPEHALLHAQFAEILDEVEGEGVEVVDDEEHGTEVRKYEGEKVRRWESRKVGGAMGEIWLPEQPKATGDRAVGNTAHAEFLDWMFPEGRGCWADAGLFSAPRYRSRHGSAARPA